MYWYELLWFTPRTISSQAISIPSSIRCHTSRFKLLSDVCSNLLRIVRIEHICEYICGSKKRSGTVFFLWYVVSGICSLIKIPISLSSLYSEFIIFSGSETPFAPATFTDWCSEWDLRVSVPANGLAMETVEWAILSSTTLEARRCQSIFK